MPSFFSKTRITTAAWLIRFALPAGWLVLLTGMFWIGERSRFHTLYYLLLATPTLLITLLQPRLGLRFWRHPLVLLFLAFAGYMLLTLAWSDTDTSAGSLAKRPLYILMLLFSAGYLAQQDLHKLLLALKIAAVAAVLAAVLSLGWYWLMQGGQGRFSGYGALYNPLLSAHVYGFFAAYWLASWINGQKLLDPWPIAILLLLSYLLLSTGSRTPLLALSACILWLAALQANRRSLLAIGALVLTATLSALLMPEALLQRGMSHRPQIWYQTLQLIAQAPWLGYGFDHSFELHVTGLHFGLAEPHNLMLAVLYHGGVVGGTLWLALYGCAFFYAWRHRKLPVIQMASTLLIFGFVAGMTEGGAFMSRPKEHWFLIWIPFALLFGIWIAAQVRREEKSDESPEEARTATA